MKKILLAVLVLCLAVCCFATVATASAATVEEMSIQDTLAERGYFKYGSDYYTPTWNVDYGKLTNVWSEQPFWANSGDIAANHFGDGVSALKIMGTDTTNTQIGGINNDAGSPIKISKNPVKTYFQFDIDVEGFTMVNLWTSGGIYTAVISDGNSWRVEGEIEAFQPTRLDKGWRLSYCIDMSKTNAANMYFNLNTTGSGAVYVGNLLVAEIDTVCEPWVSADTVTYDINNPADVDVNLDAKGKAITSVTCGGETVAAANYSYAGETLTLKAAAFDGKTTDLDFVVTTEGGIASFTVTHTEGKKTVTATLASSDPINKYFDGTTDVKKEIKFNLAGVESGHDVTVSYTAAYDSTAIGTGKTITINLSLTGADVSFYQLANDTLTITGCEIYSLIDVTPSYVGSAIEKYEDGTTNVTANITLTLTGVAEGDTVTASFDAAYASAAAGNVNINVSNIVLEGEDAHKYQLTATTLTIDGKINARTPVTASYNGEIEKRYDGTSFLDINGIVLTLSNIADGDQVSVKFKAAFISEVAGDRTVQFTNLELTGRDAHKYVLSSTSFEKIGYIIEMKDVAIADGKGYYTMDGQTLQHFDFENVPVGSVSGTAISGLNIEPSSGMTQVASVEKDNGNKYLKIEQNCGIYAAQLVTTNATGVYRDAGIYAVSFKVKLEGAKLVTAMVRNAWDNDLNSILADFRWNVTYDGQGNTVLSGKELGGWTGTIQKYFHEQITPADSDGWVTCYFEFELPEGISFGDKFCPVVVFNAASVDATTVATIYLDDISYICKSTANKYMTIDHDYDFEGRDGDKATNTPFTTNLEDGFVYDANWTEGAEVNTVIRLDIPANNSEPVAALNAGALKLLKGTGLHYVQFDFDTTCASFSMFALGYFDIQCTNNAGQYVFNVEVYQPSISNFTSQIAENGMTRISFLLDMTGIPVDGFELRLKPTTNNMPGEIYFDNLFVSHEDYTPLASNTNYNLVGNDDVVFNVDLKGARITGLELDGSAVDKSAYTYNAAAGTITLDRALFAGKNSAQLKILNTERDVFATATIVDNRAEVTLTLNYTGAAIAKDYDGTTTVEQAIKEAIIAAIEISGVTAGDDVSVICDVAYSSKNAGAVTIEITNIALAGDNAADYKLGTTSLSLNATINKIQLTVDGTTADNKVYDGNTNATATAGTLQGVLAGESVTLNVTGATFNSKNVADANKVTVVYAISGADAANYLAPVSEDIDNVEITKKTINVTAEAKSVTVGQNDPALTYTVTGLVAGDALTGALTREEGSEVGDYDILIGTLSAGGNYTINFVSAKLTITEAGNQGGDEPGGDDPSDDDPTPPKDNGRLPTIAIVGIVVGSVVVAGGAALAVVLILKKRRSK